METLLSRLEALTSFKELLKIWCRRNEIKVSFLVDMTFSKSKTIYAKLLKTYSKGLNNFKLRWLENELKLFHFCLLAVSTINEIRIKDFGEKQWQMLSLAFPNKSQAILEYETMNFITNKNMLKKKWENQEDNILSEIISKQEESFKWNQIAVQLFLKSDKKYFRSSKQCRERWLNHLDVSIKHQKWTDQQDKILIESVLKEGKKWSQIMRVFGNQRTEHMIKNRFISLILKYKKIHPFIQDEEDIINKIAQDMEIVEKVDKDLERHQIEKKLRHKPKKVEIQESQNQLNSHKITEQNQKKPEPIISTSKFPINEHSLFQPHQINHHTQDGKLEMENMIHNVPTPNFISPLNYINCNSFASNFAYFQYYMGCLQRDYNSN